MLMDRGHNYLCSRHRIFDYLKKGLNEELKLVLQKIDNISKIVDDSGLTLLHYSVKYGNAKMTQYLIDKGCSVDAQDNFQITPLMLAIKAKDATITKILLKNNADIYVTDFDGTSCLELAFHLRLYLTSCVPLNKKSHLILEMLFDKVNHDFLKGNLKHFMLNANNLLKLAFVVFGNVEIINFMLQNCYSINFQEPKRGLTALHCTIDFGRFQAAKILIEHGANVDILSEGGFSPLVSYGINSEDVDEESQILKSLLIRSTRLAVPNQRGFTDVESLLLFSSKKTIKAILQSSVVIDACFRDGRSLLPLVTCNFNADTDVLNVLDELKIQFDVNQREHSEHTALMIAAYYGCPKKVEFLLLHNADVNLTTSFGDSALSFVNVNSRDNESDVAKVMELLLLYGANVQNFWKDRPYLTNNFSLGTKVIVADLAMLEALEKQSLTDLCRSIIESDTRKKAYFDLCSQQLNEMKEFVVHGAVTLFKLLSEKEEKIVAYARNRELILTFYSAMRNLSHLEHYYLNILKRRVSAALKLAKMQEKAALVIEALVGLSADVHYTIVYKIINYLNDHGLCNICEMESIHQ